jgi:hypothetical protein
VARASDFKWAAAAVAGVYTTFVLLVSWTLPLFPAEPKLGPVYTHVVQFIPPEFPLLVLVPAFALDLLWQRTADWGAWKQALVSGTLFLAVFAAVQWPFGDFLMSPAARNWVFGTGYFGYYTRPTSVYARYQFFPMETGADFWKEAAIALALAICTTRFGLAWGDWMRRIRR